MRTNMARPTGWPRDRCAQAEALHARAARRPVKAADNYGLLLFQRGAREEALPYISAAAMRGDPRAQYVLGIAHFNGDLVKKDWRRAYALLTLANSAGLPQARGALAQMDEYIPLEDREAAQPMAAALKAEAEAARARQLAAVDLALGTDAPTVPVVTTPAQPQPVARPAGTPRVAGTASTAGSAGADYTLPSAQPTVVAAQKAEDLSRAAVTVAAAPDATRDHPAPRVLTRTARCRAAERAVESPAWCVWRAGQCREALEPLAGRNEIAGASAFTQVWQAHPIARGWLPARGGKRGLCLAEAEGQACLERAKSQTQRVSNPRTADKRRARGLQESVQNDYASSRTPRPIRRSDRRVGQQDCQPGFYPRDSGDGHSGGEHRLVRPAICRLYVPRRLSDRSQRRGRIDVDCPIRADRRQDAGPVHTAVRRRTLSVHGACLGTG